MVSKDTIISDVFGEIHSLLNSNAITITDSNGNSVTLKSSNDNYWIGAYPDNVDIDSKSTYPLGIIHTPTPDENVEGFRFKEAFIPITLEVLGTRADHPAKFIDLAKKVLRNNEATLQGAGLYQLEMEQPTSDLVMRDQIKIHILEQQINLNFAFEDSI